MAYYSDLSPCDHFRQLPVNVVAVGWLEKGHEFTVGDTSREVFSKLRLLRQRSWFNHHLHFLGWHACDFCQYDPYQSSANLFVPGKGVTYVAPEGILHYIGAHCYCPPKEFCEAVMACPPMTSDAYFDTLQELGWPPDSLRSRETSTNLRTRDLESAFNWAGRLVLLARAAQYEHLHGRLPVSISEIDVSFHTSGLQFKIVDQSRRISFQETTLGDVVEIEIPDLQHRSFWEYRDGEWWRHDGFTEGDGPDDRRVADILKVRSDAEPQETTGIPELFRNACLR